MTISDLAYLEDISEETRIMGRGAQYVDGGILYTVDPGITLSTTTSFYYADGTASCYEPVADINGIADPNKINAGQPLFLPNYVSGCGTLVV